jgi:hypothetical protein
MAALGSHWAESPPLLSPVDVTAILSRASTALALHDAPLW